MGKPMYAIIGTKKLKTYGNIKGSIMHMMRERETANSNGKENDMLLPPMSFEKVKEEIEQYKSKANSVKALELMLTASPEFFQGKTEAEIQEWERASLLWAQDKFGKGNILLCVGHRDESTIHLSLLICPAVNGSLNCRYFTGGKAKMRELWTGYAQAMGRFGLERGKEYSPAQHKDIQEYYADINQSNKRARARKVKAENLPSPGLKDHANPREYAAKMVNAATASLQKANAHLYQENQNLAEELMRVKAQAADIIKAGEILKENPAKFAEMELELMEQKKQAETAYNVGYEAGRTEQGNAAKKYAELERATIQFFNECIDKRSPIRFTNKAPKYFKSFPAIYPHTLSHVLGMLDDKKKDMEQTRIRGRE